MIPPPPNTSSLTCTPEEESENYKAVENMFATLYFFLPFSAFAALLGWFVAKSFQYLFHYLKNKFMVVLNFKKNGLTHLKFSKIVCCSFLHNLVVFPRFL